MSAPSKSLPSSVRSGLGTSRRLHALPGQSCGKGAVPKAPSTEDREVREDERSGNCPRTSAAKVTLSEGLKRELFSGSVRRGDVRSAVRLRSLDFRIEREELE